MLDLLASPEAWAALVTLIAMEIVLGIDNIVFLGVIVSRLPEPQATRARQIGLGLALFFRVALLLALTWLMALDEPVFTLFDHGFSWRDVILIAGGGFLLVKGTLEIHSNMEDEEDEPGLARTAKASLGAIVAQIVAVDLVFSVDSIITAIGMARDVEIMIAAVMVAIAVMYFASGPVTHFIGRHPTTKMLALAFLMLIGLALIADGFGVHIPRGYIYSAMAFSALVEFLNVSARARRKRRRATEVPLQR
ncbi:TerC family protein [Terrihabitans sp. B22-R8]|uniref:TerC family protein n=1 Tax=Terrihabitans sp. B22-R8 TaxID=3425128 RepID=UPI00403C6BD3